MGTQRTVGKNHANVLEERTEDIREPRPWDRCTNAIHSDDEDDGTEIEVVSAPCRTLPSRPGTAAGSSESA